MGLRDVAAAEAEKMEPLDEAPAAAVDEIELALNDDAGATATTPEATAPAEPPAQATEIDLPVPANDAFSSFTGSERHPRVEAAETATAASSDAAGTDAPAAEEAMPDYSALGSSSADMPGGAATPPPFFTPEMARIFANLSDEERSAIDPALSAASAEFQAGKSGIEEMRKALTEQASQQGQGGPGGGIAALVSLLSRNTPQVKLAKAQRALETRTLDLQRDIKGRLFDVKSARLRDTGADLAKMHGDLNQKVAAFNKAFLGTEAGRKFMGHVSEWSTNTGMSPADASIALTEMSRKNNLAHQLGGEDPLRGAFSDPDVAAKWAEMRDAYDGIAEKSAAFGETARTLGEGFRDQVSPDRINELVERTAAGLSGPMTEPAAQNPEDPKRLDKLRERLSDMANSIREMVERLVANIRSVFSR